MALPSLFFIGLCFIIGDIISYARTSKSEPLVTTDLGQLQGSVLHSDENQDFFAFRGIPYAQPPVKHLRFKPPEPVHKWSGVLDASEDGSACIQLEMITRQFMGDEDCLYLNVYTPQLPKQDKEVSFPVMVFIPGGSYIMGTAQSTLYGPHRLIDRNVVIVTINYRLGAFGFLSTEDDVSPGNYGLMDQIEALQWIQHNIRAFGGDPNQVTIFGESAGSLSVLSHLISPLAKGLFHGVIAQSGSPYCDGLLGLMSDPLRWATLIGEYLKCPTDDTNKLVYCLRKKPALELLIQSLKIDAAKHLAMGFKFAPSFEKSTKPGYLPKGLSSLKDVKILNEVPVIIGVNKDEGIFIYGLSALTHNATGRENMKKVLPNILTYYLGEFSEEQQTAVYDKILQEYDANDENLSEEKIAKILSKIYGDLIFSGCTDETIQQLTEAGLPTYAYKLTYARSKDYGMVNHGADLQYLFRCGYMPDNMLLEGDDKIISDIMTSLWTSFAKTRKPDLSATKGIYPDVKWKPITNNQLFYIDINKTPSITEGPLCEKTEFWKQILALSVQSNAKEEL